MNERSSERRGLGLKNTLYENLRKLIHYIFGRSWEEAKKVSKETETRIPRPQVYQQYSKCLGVDSGTEHCKMLPEGDRNTEVHGDH